MHKPTWTDENGRAADLTLDYEVNLHKLGYYMAQVVPVKTGKLREAVRNPSCYSYNRRLKAIRMEVRDVPYAKYADEGGRIPTRYPVRARVMRWFEGSTAIFAKRARGYYYQGIGYVENGFELWLSAYSDRDNVRIYWGRRRRA